MARYAITARNVVSALGASADASHRQWTRGPEATEASFELPEQLAAPPQPWAESSDRILRAAWAVIDGLGVAMADASRRWGPAKLGVLVGASGRPRDGAFDDALLELVRRHARARGPSYAITGGLAASGRALRSAAELLDAGVCDAVVIVAVSGPVSPRREFWRDRDELGDSDSGPFHARRSGLQPGEGAAAVLLERQGRAEVELRGLASWGDPLQAIRRALEQAGASARQLTWALCGADGRVEADAALASALRSELGSVCPVTSTVAHRGSLGAAQDLAAVVEVVTAIEAGRLGPLRGASRADPRFSLPLIGNARALETDLALTLHAGVEDDFTAIVLGTREV